MSATPPKLLIYIIPRDMEDLGEILRKTVVLVKNWRYSASRDGVFIHNFEYQVSSAKVMT
jgi:triphosphoribosyl-dephospho-CoA synthetase